MAEVIDELLVRLGLQTDKQQFQQAEAQFASLRRGAMAFAGTIGAGLGLDALTRGVAGVNDQLGLTSQQLGVTARDIDSLGFALERSGGQAQDAVSLLGSATNAIDQLLMGNIPGFELASRWGLDPDSLQQSADGMQFLLRLSDQLEGRSAQEQRNILEAFGLGGTGTFNLLTGGRNDLEGLLQRAQELSPTIDSLIDNSREFNVMLADLAQAMRGITNELSNNILPDLTTAGAVLTNWLVDNRSGIVSIIEQGPAEFGAEYGAAVRARLASLIGGVEIRRGQGGGTTTVGEALGFGVPQVSQQAIEAAISVSRGAASANLRDNAALRAAVAQAERDIGAPQGLLWAQIGQESNFNPRAVSSAGARGLAQIMPGTERSLEGRFGRDLDPFSPMDALMMQTEVMRENFERFGNWDDALRAYNAGWSRAEWNNPETLGYVPGVRGRMQGGGGQTVHIEINGARDPVSTAEEVERVLRRTADNSRQDLANGVY